MSCSSCQERLNKIRRFATRLFYPEHKCDYVQTGIWYNEESISMPLLICRICKKEKK